MGTQLSGIARSLIANNILTASEALKAANAATQKNISFVEHVLESDLIAGDKIALAIAKAFGLPFLELDAINQSLLPHKLVDRRLVEKHSVLPLLNIEKTLFLAISNPAKPGAVDDITFQTGLNIKLLVVEERKLRKHLQSFLRQNEHYEVNLSTFDDSALERKQLLTETAQEYAQQNAALDETPIVRFVRKLLLDAVRNDASDIHIEPYESTCRIRFRIDGNLHEVTQPPIKMAGRIVARLKVMAQLDISEKRLPQDGRISLRLSRSRSVQFRVSCLPTSWGEKIVLRLLDPEAARIDIETLGFSEVQKAAYLRALSKRQGMILVTGPTGSGKTVSLYWGLNTLNTKQANISTAEDPIEMNIDGINQVPVNTKTGLNFATALRAFLRQDPDIIMIGEIRDLETAEMAIQAAQTGHLLLSTLHTNSAAETLSRLRGMGIADYNLATSISLLIAQRLARRLCADCKERQHLPETILRDQGFNPRDINKLHIYRANGCENCRNGYRGRIGIYEVVPVTAAISRIIMAGGNSMEIAEQAISEGFSTLREAALCKVTQGLISLEEANRLT